MQSGGRIPSLPSQDRETHYPGVLFFSCIFNMEGIPCLFLNKTKPQNLHRGSDAIVQMSSAHCILILGRGFLNLAV